MNDLYVAPAPDVNTENINRPFVDTFIPDSSVIDLARDSVKGHLEDYYFFQYDEDEYVLIFSDSMQVDENGMSCQLCRVVVFQRLDIPDSVSSSLALSGDITEVGATPSVDTVSLSGSVDSVTYTHSWKSFEFGMPSIHVYQRGYVYYSSVGEYAPKLNESGDYFAFAGFALAVGVIAFKLLDRVFRRVY